MGVGEIATHGNRFAFTQRVLRFDLQVPQEDWCGGLQPDVSIDPGIGQIVDLPAEGRDVWVLRAINFYGYKVLSVAQQTRQTRFEWGVPILVRRHLLAIQIDDGVGHRAVEL